jgi:hypothetical protein
VFALTGGRLQREFGHHEVLVEEFQRGAGTAGSGKRWATAARSCIERRS